MKNFKVIRNEEFLTSNADFHSEKDFGYEGKSDKEIWEEFKSGNENAFNYLYFNFYPKLFNYGCQFTLNRELIKDSIQDLFIDLRVKRAKLPTLAYSIKAYLYKSIRNRVLKSSKFIFISSNDHQPVNGFEIELSTEDKMIQSEININLRKKLNKALEKLTKRQKEILVYYYYEKLSYEEIVIIMNFSKVEHARVLVSRSIKKLKSEIGVSQTEFFTLMMLFGTTF